mmetsp:Transcript_82855/g.268449  ORF Transcript_82855/g.268449 Transcript_82855/m.268449 type:complete len:306 (-) Transcript_82855:125-1042(-)
MSTKAPMFGPEGSSMKPGWDFGPTPSTWKLYILRLTFSLFTNVDSKVDTSKISRTRSVHKWKRSRNMASRTNIGGYLSHDNSGLIGSGSAKGTGSMSMKAARTAPVWAAAVPLLLTRFRRPSHKGSLMKPPIIPARTSLSIMETRDTMGEVPLNMMSCTTRLAMQAVMFICPRGSGNSGAMRVMVGSICTAATRLDLPITRSICKLPLLTPSMWQASSKSETCTPKRSTWPVLLSWLSIFPTRRFVHEPPVNVKVPKSMGNVPPLPAGIGTTRPPSQVSSTEMGLSPPKETLASEMLSSEALETS